MCLAPFGYSGQAKARDNLVFGKLLSLRPLPPPCLRQSRAPTSQRHQLLQSVISCCFLGKQETLIQIQYCLSSFWWFRPWKADGKQFWKLDATTLLNVLMRFLKMYCFVMLSALPTASSKCSVRVTVWWSGVQRMGACETRNNIKHNIFPTTIIRACILSKFL